MTIKQQGGVFGRHPSFSTLEVDGQSTLGPVFAEDAGTALTATRTGTEGEIAAWYKDNTKVAGLNVLSGDAWLNVPDRAGLRFSGTGLVPLKNGAVSDAQISLGSPIYRFNSLYMSGNVIIGNNSGIDFSATSGTGTSELLDDYEEGTWTPTVVGYPTAGSASYSVQIGRYTKIGNLCYIQCWINFNSLTGTTEMRLNGIPFAAENVPYEVHPGSVQLENIPFPANTVHVNARVQASEIRLVASIDNAASSNIQCDAAGIIVVGATYRTV